MKLFPKLTPIAFGVINVLLISGCTDPDYRAASCDPNSTADCSEGVDPGGPDQGEYRDKGGVTGRVFGSDYWVGAKVCFDINRNGLCDEGTEPVEYSYAGGKYSFAPSTDLMTKAIGSKANLLALSAASQAGQAQAIYAPSPISATANDINLSPFTTLVVNEMVFNPNFLNFTVAQVQTALISNDVQTPRNLEALQGFDYVDLNATNTDLDKIKLEAGKLNSSLTQAQLIETSGHYKATGAMVDKVYKNNSHTTSIVSGDLVTQVYLDDSINAEMLSSPVSWNPSYVDEYSLTIDAQSNLAVVGSNWGNRLILLDLSTPNVTFSTTNAFAQSAQERCVDSTSGASEHGIGAVKLTPKQGNDQYVLVAIDKPSRKNSCEGVEAGGVIIADNDFTTTQGVGLYRASINNTNQTITNKIYDIDNGVNSETFYSFPTLRHIAMTKSGDKVALAGSDKTIAILNLPNFLTSPQTFSANSSIQSIALNNTSSTAYVGLLDSSSNAARTGIALFDLTTNAESIFLPTGSQQPVNLRMFTDNSKMAWNLHQRKVVSIYTIADSTQPSLWKEWAVADEILDIAFSPDDSRAIVSMQSGRVEIYFIPTVGGEPRLVNAFTAQSINSVSFPSNDRALVSIKNAVRVIDIKAKQDWTAAGALTAWATAHRQP